MHVRVHVHVTKLHLVKYGWAQGMEAAIVAHGTRKQEDAIKMNRQHVNQWVKKYSYTEFKCIIINACEDATTYAHARMISYVYISKQSIWQPRSCTMQLAQVAQGRTGRLVVPSTTETIVHDARAMQSCTVYLTMHNTSGAAGVVAE